MFFAKFGLYEFHAAVSGEERNRGIKRSGVKFPIRVNLEEDVNNCIHGRRASYKG